MSHCYSVHSLVTQVQFLPIVVRLRLCYEPGLGHWGHLGQEKRRFVASELAENFEEMGHLGHLGAP
jgi:hypothetical protein